MAFIIKNLYKAFGDRVLFEDATFSFSNCGMYIIQGESGCGKTTLLHMIAESEAMDQGERILEKDATVAYVLQNHELIESLTIEQNIDLYANLYQQSMAQKYDIIKELQLTSILTHYPRECSKGQRQRAQIAQTLCMNFDILLCDEPSASLDQENRDRVISLLHQIAKEKVVIITTHEGVYKNIQDASLYKIENKKIHPVKILSHPAYQSISKPRPCKKQVKNTMQDILRNKTKIQVLLCFMITALYLMGLWIRSEWFSFHSANDLRNQNEIYLTFYNQEPYQDLQLDQRHMFPNMKQVIEPVVDEEIFSHPDPKEEVQERQLLLNKQAAQYLQHAWTCTEEELIGKGLTTSFYFDNQQYFANFIIQEIIEEKDAFSTAQAYYDATYIQDAILDVPSMNGAQFQKDGVYTLHVDSEDLEEIYGKLQDNQNIESIKNAYVEEKLVQEKEMRLFLFVYDILFISLLSAGILLFFYFVKKEFHKNYRVFVILYLCQIPIKDIRRAYFQVKCYPMLMSICVSFLVYGVFSYCFDSFDVIALWGVGIWLLSIVLFLFYLILKIQKARVHIELQNEV